MVDPNFIDVPGTGQKLDTTVVTQTSGTKETVHREIMAHGDPTDPDAISAVIAGTPPSDAYGAVVRPVLMGGLVDTVSAVTDITNPVAVYEDADFLLRVAMGLVPGVSGVNKFGRNSDIAAGTTEDIWDGSSLYSFPTTAVITHVSQTADQAAMRGATIEAQGLDGNWALVVQTKALDASLTTTAVAWDTPMIRIFRMKVLANVVGASPIRAHNAAESVDYAIIGTGNNQTLMAIYTVPAGKTGYVIDYYATMNPATNLDPTSLDIRLWVRDNDNMYERQIKHNLGIAVTGGDDHSFTPYLPVTEKSDIYMDGSTVGKAADVSAGFDLILVDN